VKEKKSIQITLKVNPDLNERFERAARALGYKKNEAVREAMRRFVLQFEQKDRAK
jgi:predicted transcriptional regulator